MRDKIPPKRPKKKKGDSIVISVLLDNIVVYEKTGIVLESRQGTTKFRFPNNRIIQLPDTEEDLKIVNRLLKDGIQLGL